MTRPGPLQEIPLDSLTSHLYPNSNTNSKNIKRLHSPPSSPAKRRILAPDRFSKTSRLSDVPTDLLPARRLEFNTSLATTPVPSPCSAAILADAPSSPRSQTKSVSSPAYNRRRSCPPPASPSRDPPLTKYKLVPRELPPACDPGSVHYPGFTIYRDPFVPIYDDAGFMANFFKELAKDKEGIKENNTLIARRKVHKNLASGVTSPAGEKKALFMSREEKVGWGVSRLQPTGSPKKQTTSFLPPAHL